MGGCCGKPGDQKDTPPDKKGLMKVSMSDEPAPEDDSRISVALPSVANGSLKDKPRDSMDSPAGESADLTRGTETLKEKRARLAEMKAAQAKARGETSAPAASPERVTRPTANGGSPAGEHKETLKEKRARLQKMKEKRAQSGAGRSSSSDNLKALAESEGAAASPAATPSGPQRTGSADAGPKKDLPRSSSADLREKRARLAAMKKKAAGGK